jgi:hypothetical protein
MIYYQYGINLNELGQLQYTYDCPPTNFIIHETISYHTPGVIIKTGSSIVFIAVSIVF